MVGTGYQMSLFRDVSVCRRRPTHVPSVIPICICMQMSSNTCDSVILAPADARLDVMVREYWGS